MTEPIPDPGWYPDPEGAPGRARYWDGAAWTDRTRELASIESAGRSDEPPPPPAAARPWWRRPLVAAAAVVLVVVVVGAFLLVSGSKEAGAEVILQPSASSGVDPFTDSVANSKVAVKNGGFEQLTADSAAVESISGAAPGLYGGTGKEAVCDPAALVAFLKHNPDKAAAFASVVGIRPKQIPDYVAGLTPVLLREDTRVTNHGFVDGQANGFDAVLEAGTAVLVDDRGVPRVRCACGNPLSEPAPTQSTPDYSGQPWDGFNDQRLVAVTPAKQQQDSFELVDVNTGQSYEQAAGSGLTVDQLINLKIPVTVCDVPAARWVDGRHPQSGTPVPGGFGELLIEVAGVDKSVSALAQTDQLQAAVGDLNGDGANEGVVTTVEDCGSANGNFWESTYVFDSDGNVIGKLPDAANEPGASFPETHTDLQIVDGGIELTANGYTATGDHATGPTIHKRVRYELNGSSLALAGAPSSAGSSGSGSGSGSGASPGSGSGSGGLPSGATQSCGDGVSVGPQTSCPFAQNVASEYHSSGGAGTIRVYSPVTDRTYTMTCTSGSPHVCTGGHDASVYFR